MKNIKIIEKSIQILEGLDAVRKRPGMYIGSTDSKGLHHLVWEIIDNGIDEVLAGYGKEIELIIKKIIVLLLLTSVEACHIKIMLLVYQQHKSYLQRYMLVGKFGEEGGYKVSGGLHGVGSSVVNALSQFFRSNRL